MANLFKTNKAGGAAPSGNVPITIDNVGTTSDINVAGYATASVTTQGLYKPTTVKDNTGSPYTTNGEKTITGLENNTGVKIKINVSASFSETTLWTNPNPSSSYAASDEPLNYSMNNYSYIKIYYKYSTTNSEESSIMVPPSALYNKPYSTVTVFPSLSLRNGSTLRYRQVNGTTSATQIHFGNESNGSNTNLIPTKITGLS